MDNTSEREVGPRVGVIRMVNRTLRLRHLRGEKGQTPTEYLMIVGIMAAVILIAFVTFFWGTIKGATQKWSKGAASAIESSEGKESQPKQ